MEQNLGLGMLGKNELLKVNKNMCNMIGGRGAGDTSCCRFLYHLEAIKEILKETREYGITIIQKKGDQNNINKWRNVCLLYFACMCFYLISN